ncbi:MAG: hypothetical protein KI790_16525 [Cyclobacteriaceae bacterium]|nr:hypothetical protein [Cyclobacteriaceae bacterium HetDA_MAG_MS6]
MLGFKKNLKHLEESIQAALKRSDYEFSYRQNSYVRYPVRTFWFGVLLIVAPAYLVMNAIWKSGQAVGIGLQNFLAVFKILMTYGLVIAMGIYSVVVSRRVTIKLSISHGNEVHEFELSKKQFRKVLRKFPELQEKN